MKDEQQRETQNARAHTQAKTKKRNPDEYEPTRGGENKAEARGGGPRATGGARSFCAGGRWSMVRIAGAGRRPGVAERRSSETDPRGPFMVMMFCAWRVHCAAPRHSCVALPRTKDRRGGAGARGRRRHRRADRDVWGNCKSFIFLKAPRSLTAPAPAAPTCRGRAAPATAPRRGHRRRTTRRDLRR